MLEGRGTIRNSTREPWSSPQVERHSSWLCSHHNPLVFVSCHHESSAIMYASPALGRGNGAPHRWELIHDQYFPSPGLRFPWPEPGGRGIPVQWSRLMLAQPGPSPPGAIRGLEARPGAGGLGLRDGAGAHAVGLPHRPLVVKERRLALPAGIRAADRRWRRLKVAGRGHAGRRELLWARRRGPGSRLVRCVLEGVLDDVLHGFRRVRLVVRFSDVCALRVRLGGPPAQTWPAAARPVPPAPPPTPLGPPGSPTCQALPPHARSGFPSSS